MYKKVEKLEEKEKRDKDEKLMTGVVSSLNRKFWGY